MVKDKCFFYDKREGGFSYNQSVTACEEKSSTLVTIKTEDEEEEVRNYTMQKERNQEQTQIWVYGTVTDLEERRATITWLDDNSQTTKEVGLMENLEDLSQYRIFFRPHTTDHSFNIDLQDSSGNDILKTFLEYIF